MTDTHHQATRDGGRRAVQLRAVLLAIMLAFPVAYVLSVVIPEDRRQVPAAHYVTAFGTAVDPSFDGDGPINMTGEGVAIKGYDVVAYFTAGEAVKGSSDYTAEYEGATFRFASEENRDRFLADPEAYVPAYGGLCALGVANGYKDDMDPEAFDVIDGRLYFNLTPGIHQGWLSDTEQHIALADENWPALRHAPGHGPMDAR